MQSPWNLRVSLNDARLFRKLARLTFARFLNFFKRAQQTVPFEKCFKWHLKCCLLILFEIQLSQLIDLRWNQLASSTPRYKQKKSITNKEHTVYYPLHSQKVQQRSDRKKRLVNLILKLYMRRNACKIGAMIENRDATSASQRNSMDIYYIFRLMCSRCIWTWCTVHAGHRRRGNGSKRLFDKSKVN